MPPVNGWQSQLQQMVEWCARVGVFLLALMQMAADALLSVVRAALVPASA